MTTLRKLGLRGVRSYSPNGEESIAFLTPLTIIVGANGSGKTTIIEALKYASTGSLPPLSESGKSFVHDPKLEGAALVKAQIKISFDTPDNKNVLAIRNFQLSQKASKREFKAMEAVLQTQDEKGKQITLSHKCADMDRLIPQLMGVSAAVLENVTFVHQEDSLWPLGDAKTLKVKFDDIFAATRYTKALENIHKLKKEKATEIRIMQSELDVLENNVEQAHKLEDDLNSVRESIQQKGSNIESLTESINQLESRLAKLGAKQAEIKVVQESIQSLMAAKTVMEAEKAKSSQRMVTEYSDPDDELQSIYQTFKMTHQNLLKGIEEKQAMLRSKEAESANSEREMSKLSEQLGKLAAQESDYRTKKQNLIDLATRLGGDAATSSGHQALLTRLQSSFQAKQNELAAHRADMRNLDAKFESDIARLQKEESSLDEAMRIKNEQLTTCRNKRAALVRQLSELESAHRNLTTIQSRLSEAQNQLAAVSARHDPQCDEWKEQINAKMRGIQSNTQKLGLLSTQRKQLAAQADTLAQIKLKRQQLASLHGHYTSGLDSLRRELNDNELIDMSVFPRPLPPVDKLSDAFGDSSAGESTSPSSAPSDMRLDRLEQALKKKHMDVKADIQSKTEEASSASSAVSSLLSQRKSIEEQLSRLSQHVETIRQQFIAADAESLFNVPVASLEEEIVKCDKLYERFNRENMLGSSAKVMYKKFLDIAQEQHKCSLCNRGLNSAEEAAFIASISNKLDRIMPVEKAEQRKESVRQAKAKLEQMQALLPLHEQAHNMLSKEKPQLEEKLSQLQAEMSAAMTRKSSIDGELKELKDTEESVFDALKAAGSVSRLFNDLVSLYHGLRREEKKLAAEAAAAAAANGGGAPRSLEIVQNEYEALERLNVTLQRECTALQDKLEKARSDKQQLIDQVTKLKEQVMEMNRIQMEIDRIKKDEQENQQYYSTVKIDVQKVLEKLPSVKQRLSSVRQEREEGRSRGASAERLLQESVASMQRELDNLTQLVADVEKYERQLNDRSAMKAELTAKQAARQKLRQDRDKLAAEIKADQEKVAANEKIDQDIKANIEYRERSKALAEQQKKIDDRLAHLRALSGGQVLDDLKKLEDKIAKLRDKRAMQRGSINSDESHAKNIIEQLASDRLRHIDRRYRTKLIDVRTTILAAADLDTYYRALDKALMHFHSIKMKEINETLKEYWRSVYKGSDIDEIYIVSDGAIIGNKRNYNYRVVMKQGDTELDMRGRCSAGQKVLASLLIRLALADTFCSQCAVLALDEPTTNLDHKNITAFAQALNQIIERRREQSNFQLIIITHDETFVDEIGKRAHADYYYRVYKDDAQYSRIRRQALEQEEEAH